MGDAPYGVVPGGFVAFGKVRRPSLDEIRYIWAWIAVDEGDGDEGPVPVFRIRGGLVVPKDSELLTRFRYFKDFAGCRFYGCRGFLFLDMPEFPVEPLDGLRHLFDPFRPGSFPVVPAVAGKEERHAFLVEVHGAWLTVGDGIHSCLDPYRRSFCQEEDELVEEAICDVHPFYGRLVFPAADPRRAPKGGVAVVVLYPDTLGEGTAA